MENVLQFAKQNEAFLWRFLIVIVFVIVLLNLYLRQRLKINKELKKLEGEREFYNSIFLEEDSFYIHIDEQYYISQIEKLIEISGVTGEYVKSMELYAILSVKYTEIEQDEYERIILLFEKFQFIYSILYKPCIFKAYRLLNVQTLCIFPCFCPYEPKQGKFLFSADYLIQQSCGSTLRFPCSVSVNVHCGTDISVSEKFLHIFRCCTV